MFFFLLGHQSPLAAFGVRNYLSLGFQEKQHLCSGYVLCSILYRYAVQREVFVMLILKQVPRPILRKLPI